MLEYIEFKNIKLVEKLQQLNSPDIVKIIAVNRFGPDRLEMVSKQSVFTINIIWTYILIYIIFEPEVINAIHHC